MTANTGSRRIHANAHTPTLTHTHACIQCADEAFSWICSELHLHFGEQKNAYANEDNADSNQRAPSPACLSLLPLTSSPLSSSLYLSLLVSVFLVLPLPVNLPNPLHSVTLSRLSQAAEQLIAL